MKSTPKSLLVFCAVFYLVWLVRATIFYSAVDLSIPGDTARLVFSKQSS